MLQYAHNYSNNEEGFTLIEIIAVLIVLGILASIAIPKYMSMVNDARTKSLDAAISVGLSHVSMEYSRRFLEYGRIPLMTELSPTAPAGGAFSYTFTTHGGADGYVIIDVENDNGDKASGIWNAPN